MKLSPPLILAAAIALISPVLAGGEHSPAGKHGGKVVESGHHHIEVVTKDGTLEVYVMGEDGEPEEVKDAKAKAVVLS